MIHHTTPVPVPLLSAIRAERDAVPQATTGVIALAGLRGLPEAALSLGAVEGAPVALSPVAGPGRNRALPNARRRRRG